MFDFDPNEVESMAKQLKRFRRKAYPFAVRQMLNDTAWDARRFYQEGMRDGLTLRNKWTEKGARAQPERRELNVDRMETRAGHLETYMLTQEKGATIVKQGKHGVPIPTSWAAGQEGAQPRTRLVKKANRMGVIKLKQKWKALGNNDHQRLVRAAQIAVDTKDRYIYAQMPDTDRKGIYKVIGGRKGTTKGWPKGAKIKLVHDLSHKSVTLHPTPLLETASNKARKRMDVHFRKALLFQIERNKLFR
jgi:hypothetical protein